MDLSKLTIEELLQYESATRLICRTYENELKSYDGSITGDASTVKEFDDFNKRHIKILEEIKKRVEKI